MVDNALFDNNNTTQRVINASIGTQTFSNSGSDTSFSVGTGDANDYFRLQVGRTSSLILSLQSQGGDANLALLDNTGNPVDGLLYSSTNPGSLVDAFVTDPLVAGTYYIRVYTSDTSITTNYTLSVNTIPNSRADLLWREYTTDGSNIVWKMNNSSVVSTQTVGRVPAPSWNIVGTADYDSDGIADYYWREDTSGDSVVWLLNNAGTVKATATLPKLAAANWKIEGVGDFNNDGRPDLFWRDSTSGQNVVWFLNGSTVIGTANITSIPTNWRIETIADYNGDGRPDVIWRDYSNGQGVAWLFNGTTVIGTNSLPTRPTTWRIEGVGDFDGDGKGDLVWRNYSGTSDNGKTEIWYMNGSAVKSTFALATVPTNYSIASVLTTLPRIDLAGDTMATAFNAGTLNATGSYTDAIGQGDLNDYYRINLSTAGKVSLSLQGLTANADLWLIEDKNNNGAIDSFDEVIARSENAGNASEQISNIDLAAGSRYYVLVKTTSTTQTDYSLTLSKVEIPPKDLLPESFALYTTGGTQITPSSQAISITNAQTIQTRYNIRYTGPAGETPATFRVGFYLSRDQIISTAAGSGDKRLDLNGDGLINDSDYVTISNLAVGSTTGVRTQNVIIPNADDEYWGGDQVYYIGIIIDDGGASNPNGQIIETFETNNTIAAGIPIKDTKRPDLVGDGLSLRLTGGQEITSGTPLTPGSSFYFTGAIRNNGNSPTTTLTNPTFPAGTFTVNYYFSSDNLLDGNDFFLTSARVTRMERRGDSSGRDRVNFDSRVTTDPGGSNPRAVFNSASPVRVPTADWTGWRGDGTYYVVMEINPFGLGVSEGEGGLENNSNYGRTFSPVQYLDFDFVPITGAPNNG